MNVKELKQCIKDLPDDMEVVLSRDPEGNGYGTLEGADSNSIYEDEDVYSTDWTHEDARMEEDVWDEFKKKPRVLCLWPN